MAAMLELADILYDINLEVQNGRDFGVYIKGVTYAIYPTGYVEDSDAVQCHLVQKKKPTRNSSDGLGGLSTYPDFFSNIVNQYLRLLAIYFHHIAVRCFLYYVTGTIAVVEIPSDVDLQQSFSGFE